MYLCNVDDVNRQEEEAVKKESILIKHEDNTRNVDQQTPKELIVRLDTGSKSDGSGYHPLIVPMNHDLNNDIYFIGKHREVVKYARKWTDSHD